MLQITQIDHLREGSAQLHYLEPFASKQREQAGKTRCHHGPLASLPGAVSAQQASAPGSLSTCLAPTSFPKLTGTYSLQRGPLYIRPFLYNKQERDYIEKAGELRKLSGGCHCLPLHLHRVAGSSTRGSGLPAKLPQHIPRHIHRALLAPNKGSKQDQQGITTRTWPLHPRSSSGSGGQCPGHQLGSYWPAKNTQQTRHTQPMQRLLLHKATFSSLAAIPILSN